MDLANYDVEKKSADGATLVLKNPVNGKPLIDEESKEPVSIVLLSADSKDARERQHEIAGKSLNEALGTRRKVKVDVSQMDADTVALLAALTKNWKHIVVDGTKVACSAVNAIALYTRFPWMREQVEAFVNDRSNFLGN